VLTSLVVAITVVVVDELNTMGKRVRFARLARKIGSREMARRAGLAYEGHTSQLESDRGQTSAEIVSKVAKVLDVSMEWLVDGGELPDSLKEAPAEPTTDFQCPVSPTGTEGGR
jgi:transcriptional regulator with XRE-family HTH domain